jgi:hypothetical protein
MNCSKGDVARTTGLPPPLVELRDRFVTCAELFFVGGDAQWRFERPIEITIHGDCHNTYTGARYRKGDRLTVRALPDKLLRPLRGSDDDRTVHEFHGLTVIEGAPA